VRVKIFAKSVSPVFIFPPLPSWERGVRGVRVKIFAKSVSPVFIFPPLPSWERGVRGVRVKILAKIFATRHPHGY